MNGHKPGDMVTSCGCSARPEHNYRLNPVGFFEQQRWGIVIASIEFINDADPGHDRNWIFVLDSAGVIGWADAYFFFNEQQDIEYVSR